MSALSGGLGEVSDGGDLGASNASTLNEVYLREGSEVCSTVMSRRVFHKPETRRNWLACLPRCQRDCEAPPQTTPTNCVLDQ